MIYYQHDYRSDHGDEHAVEVKSCYPSMADRAKQPATDDRTDDPKEYIKKEALSRLLDDFGRNKAGN